MQEPTETNPIFHVRRQWNNRRMASYFLSQIEEIHWAKFSGGIGKKANRAYLHGYVMCDAMIEGRVSHSCRHGPPPHKIKVCITKKFNEKIWHMAEALAKNRNPKL